MDYGKYIDIAVQNPRGKEMLRLIQQPENFSKLVDTVGTFGLRPIRTPQGKIEVVRDEEEEEKEGEEKNEKKEKQRKPIGFRCIEEVEGDDGDGDGDGDGEEGEPDEPTIVCKPEKQRKNNNN